MDIIIWILIAVLFIILELTTNTFFLVWFGIGALVSAILNYFNFDIYVQVSAFILISVILLLSTRKFALRITEEPGKKAASERLIGKKAVIIKKLNDGEAIVTVDGDEWRAIIPDGSDVDDIIEISSIDSVRLITKRTD